MSCPKEANLSKIENLVLIFYITYKVLSLLLFALYVLIKF